jgi:hypothetical protein
MKRLAIIVTLLAASTWPVMAILGLGDIVYDPTNYANAMEQLVQLEQQYQQLVQTYQLVRNQYDQMVWMAKQVPVAMGARYRALVTPWVATQAANTYGPGGAWLASVNSGANVSGGYGAVTEGLETYGAALNSIPADQVDRLKNAYATVELTDGANRGVLQTLGTLRGNAAAVEATIANLENDSLSADPSMNTEIAVLNKINAAGIIALRNGQDTNKLLAGLAEERLLASKRERDAEARAFNQHIRFMSEGKSLMTAQSANASAAMMAWRMP